MPKNGGSPKENASALKTEIIDGLKYVTCPLCKDCSINTAKCNVVDKGGNVTCPDCGGKFMTKSAKAAAQEKEQERRSSCGLT